MCSGGIRRGSHSTCIHTQCGHVTQAPRFCLRFKTFKICPYLAAFSSLIQGGPVIERSVSHPSAGSLSHARASSVRSITCPSAGRSTLDPRAGASRLLPQVEQRHGKRASVSPLLRALHRSPTVTCVLYSLGPPISRLRLVHVVYSSP